MKNFYNNENWEILDYYEEKTKTKIQKENEEFLFCAAAYICARKIKNE